MAKLRISEDIVTVSDFKARAGKIANPIQCLMRENREQLLFLIPCLSFCVMLAGCRSADIPSTETTTVNATQGAGVTPKPDLKQQKSKEYRTLTTSTKGIIVGFQEFKLTPWFGPYVSMKEFCKTEERDCTDLDDKYAEVIPQSTVIKNGRPPFLDVAVGAGAATVDGGDVGLLVRTNTGWFAPYWWTSQFNAIEHVEAQVVETALGPILQIDYGYRSGGKWGMSTSNEVIFCGLNSSEILVCTMEIYRQIQGEIFWGSTDGELTKINSRFRVELDRSGILSIVADGRVDSHYKSILGNWKLDF